ncbi:MAG: DUF4082 domain-containing protein [Pirellulales bacterium]
MPTLGGCDGRHRGCRRYSFRRRPCGNGDHRLCAGRDTRRAGPALVAFSADSTIGWSFTPRVDLRLTELGFYDGGIGLGLRHAVGLWDASGQLLASSELGGNRATGRVVPPGEDATPWPRLHDGDYLFAAIEPIHLLAGETYVIGATVPLFARRTDR